MESARLLACTVVMLMANSAPAVHADALVNGYVGPTALVNLANAPKDERITTIRRKAQYHIGVADLELEQAVSRAAQQHHVQPALLLAMMKVKSPFNSTAVSKAGAG